MGKIRVLDRQLRRKRRNSFKITGTKNCPRISVFRSNRHIYIQAIDDEKRMTIGSFSTLRGETNSKGKKICKKDQAKLVGLKLADQLKKAGIKKAVFDRGAYKYQGRLASAADGLREGGIKI